jgi:hypothetical protein
VDDLKKAQAAWWLLQRAAETALDMCQKAMPAEEEQEASAAEGAAEG